MRFVLINDIYGHNQFAYRPERGARDALAHMVLTWITALAKGRKVALYCSDVSGAFDRVNPERLVAKLKAKKIHPTVVAVIKSWLRNRRAKVVVGVGAPEEFALTDMVFQGTVFGPLLWNTFYEDAKRAINEMSFTEIVHADDLNAHREFLESEPNSRIRTSLGLCQKELHSWGEANQVTFDPTKESFHILWKGVPAGEDF